MAESIDYVTDELASIELAKYTPISIVESLVPKGKLSFRTAHQMFPMDCVLFTAAVFMLGQDVERNRLSPEEKTAFSYRFCPDDDGAAFAADCNYHHWLDYQHSLLLEDMMIHNSISEVIRTDISDFYQRIYHHRLENILAGSGPDIIFVNTIRNFLRAWRARQSFGIPVGGSASRLLAEALLNDTDVALRDEGFRFTRYVDDYVIWLTSKQDHYDAISLFGSASYSYGGSIFGLIQDSATFGGRLFARTKS